MRESGTELKAGWAKKEIVPPARFPMAGYLARQGNSRGALDSLYIRALALEQGKWRGCILTADLLMLSSVQAGSIRRRIAEATGVPAQNVILSATHTHSGPLVDTGPFRLSRGRGGIRAEKFSREIEHLFVAAAIEARAGLKTVQAHFSHFLVRGLATDRNNPAREREQTVFLIRFDTNAESAVFCLFPCHPTVLGADNRYYSGDLHGEIARRFERQHGFALVANGPCANISTRFTRRNQSSAQIARFAASFIRQAEAARLRRFTPGSISTAARNIRLPVKDFRQSQNENDADLAGRRALVAKEGRAVARQLSKSPEFRSRSISVPVIVFRLGPVALAALPFELYAATGDALWARARALAVCYANGYWGYVYPKGTSPADYEVISSPFTQDADGEIRQAVLALAMNP